MQPKSTRTRPCAECGTIIEVQGRRRFCVPCAKQRPARRHSLVAFGGLREAVLARDNYRCTECGKPWDAESRSISVHHRDEDKTNNTMENLITLCRSCHRHAHGLPTPETRAKMAAAQRARKHPSPRPFTELHRQRIGEGNKGKRNTPEAIERMKEAKRKWWAEQTPERRAEIGRNVSAAKLARRDE